jgi:hypothetical protein
MRAPVILGLIVFVALISGYLLITDDDRPVVANSPSPVVVRARPRPPAPAPVVFAKPAVKPPETPDERLRRETREAAEKTGRPEAERKQIYLEYALGTEAMYRETEFRFFRGQKWDPFKPAPAGFQEARTEGLDRFHRRFYRRWFSGNGEITAAQYDEVSAIMAEGLAHWRETRDKYLDARTYSLVDIDRVSDPDLEFRQTVYRSTCDLPEIIARRVTAGNYLEGPIGDAVKTARAEEIREEEYDRMAKAFDLTRYELASIETEGKSSGWPTEPLDPR